MVDRKWAVIAAVVALAAAIPAAAADGKSRGAGPEPARVASAKAAIAPAPSRPAPSEDTAGTGGDHSYLPAERMADSIAEYYASGKMRVY